MSWEAKNWACDQRAGKAMLKLVLLGTCNFVSKHTGKTRVHPDTVAEWCEINKAQTVSDAQQELASKGLLIDTGERIGRNGQTIVWTPGWKKHSHATDTSLTPHSHPTRTPLTPPSVASDIGKVGTEPDNLDTLTNKPDDDSKALGNSLAGGQPSPAKSSVSVFEEYQNQPAQSHIKWPEFAGWCRSKRDKRGLPGAPTEEGFWKWLCAQKPQWRNKVKERFEESGYVLNGKWLTADEANHLGRENPQLLTKFRAAVKRNGKIMAGDSATKQGD